ncbi:MAG: cytochrome c [Ignavibacteria bacterium]|nr:cytochrome c [Ignavibacteria bacterium]
MNRKSLYALGIVGLALVAGIVSVLSSRTTWFSESPPIEVLPNLDLQFKDIPQSGNTFFADRKSLRDPVEGTVARGATTYLLGQGDIELAETNNVDPEIEKSAFVLSRGQNRFNVFCSPCHNYDAKGESIVAVRGEWAGIPNLTRPETSALSNSRIFHIISAGQNLMPSYADKISPIDRWTIIYYLRSLQNNNAQ